MKCYEHHVDGRAMAPSGGEWLASDDPWTGQPWAQIARGNATDVDAAVAAARRVFRSPAWAGLTASVRGDLLRRVADTLAAEAETLAETESRDNGKRLAEVLPQLRYLCRGFHYCAGLADKVEGAVIPIDVPDVFNHTRWEPLGVIAAITPWNSPLMLAAWKIAPALAAGNTVVIKPSEHASASTVEFVRLLERGGLPPGAVNVVCGLGPEAGEPLVLHADVAKVSFTGSVAGGRRVAELAARGLKRTTMELGGKSPQIVFDDASMDDAINGVLAGIFLSNGQSCVAGSRLLLQASIHDSFVERLTARVRGLRMGDPRAASTQLGPLANRPHLERVLGHIERAHAEGAHCVLGGAQARRAECGNGWFVEPTVFTGVRPHMALAREEVFGPVLAVMTFHDEDEAVAMANDTPFGLAAGIWTRDSFRAQRLAGRIEAGTVYLNTYRGVSVMSPVGGYKSSGYGRENGLPAIHDYLQLKSVWQGTAPQADPFPGRQP